MTRLAYRTACVFGVAALLAAAEPSPSSGRQVVVALEMATTGFFNGIDGQTYAGGAAGRSLQAGESGVAWVSAGSPGRLDDWCRQGIGSNGPEHKIEGKEMLLKSAGSLWWAEFTLVSANAEKIVVLLDWEHWTVEASGRRSKVGGDHRRIEMPEGEAHVLDFAAPDTGGEPTCARNVTVRLTARAVEDVAFEDQIFDLDLWLEHRVPDSPAVTRHFQAIGGQGEPVRFRLLPLRFPVGKEERHDAILEVMGSMRARLLTDGLVEIDLGATRWTDVESRGEPRRGGVGSGGRKVFQVRPGESVALPLPPASGSHGVALPDGQEVTFRDETIFGGHEDRLILTVTPRI